MSSGSGDDLDSRLDEVGPVLDAFGFPLRTTNTMVLVYAVELFGRRCSQPLAIKPALRMASVSGHIARLTTSGFESVDDRAGLRPRAAVDCLIVTLRRWAARTA